MRRRPLPPADQMAVVEKYKSGEKIEVIAESFSIHSGRVSEIVKRHGVKLRGRRRIAEREAIAERYRAGDPIPAIAARFGIYHSSVTKIAREFGVPPRGQGRPQEGNASALTLGRFCRRNKITINDLEALVIKHALLDQSPDEIAGELGCTPRQAQKVIAECGRRGWP